LTGSEDNTARVWQARPPTLIATLSGHTDRLRTAAFSPDGKRVITVSADRTARLWELSKI
jgi:WD40 repeat protein